MNSFRFAALILIALVPNVSRAQDPGKCLVSITIPEGGKLFINDTPYTTFNNALTIDTRDTLELGKVYFWDVRVEVTKNGKTHRETAYVRLWRDRKVEIDLSDVANPDKKARTERYWNELAQLHRDFEPKGKPTPEQVIRILNTVAEQTEKMTSRGVDPDLVKELIDLPGIYRGMATIVFRNTPEQQFINGLREGFNNQGDPLAALGNIIGGALNDEQKLKALADETKSKFAKLRKLMSNRYDLDLAEIK